MFFPSLLSSLWYFSFYHLLFFREESDKKVSHKSVKTLSTQYFHFLYIFSSLFILSRVTSLLTCNFELENDLETSCNFQLVFTLKYFYSCCYCYCYFGYPRQFTGDPRHSPIRLSRKRKKAFSSSQKILDQPKNSRPPKKFSAHENKSRDQYQFSKGGFASRVMN